MDFDAGIDQRFQYAITILTFHDRLDPALRVLDQASQGEAEKRVIAGARALLDYYLAAEEIRRYKQ